MNANERKIFVGGYYKSNIDINDIFDDIPLYDEDHLDIYTLSEALKLGFVENVIEWFEEETGKLWDDISEEEKIKAILDYTIDDDIAGLEYCEDAVLSKSRILKKIKEYNNQTQYD